MNEVKPTNVALVPAGSTSASAKQGQAAESQTVVSGKQLPPSATVAPTAPAADVKEVAEEKQQSLSDAVSQLNDYVQSTQRDLHFSFDEDAGKPVVTVLDRETQQVIRRIPDDVVLNLARKLNDDEPLRLFSAQA